MWGVLSVPRWDAGTETGTVPGDLATRGSVLAPQNPLYSSRAGLVRAVPAAWLRKPIPGEDKASHPESLRQLAERGGHCRPPRPPALPAHPCPPTTPSPHERPPFCHKSGPALPQLLAPLRVPPWPWPSQRVPLPPWSLTVPVLCYLLHEFHRELSTPLGGLLGA